MRRDISLYIGSQLADINDDTLILYNYTREEMTDPAVVKNSYSQQVKLPATKNNDAIFGYFFKSDRKTVSGGGTGSYFNALVKTPFTLYDDKGQILERGYCQLVKMTNDKDGRSYVINLYGGLGEFFYNLSYKDDGSKRTLADMAYCLDPQTDPTDYIIPEREPQPINRNKVHSAWTYLHDYPSGKGYYSFFNFAPCNDGIPQNFDAKHAVYKPYGASINGARVENLYTSKTQGGVTYTPDSSANGHILIEMQNEHNMYEMQDLRSYLLRPVLRVRYIFEAICNPANNGGYSVDFRANADDDYEWYWNGWLTLPLVDREKYDLSQLLLSDILSGTKSPAEYLISWCKMFGFVFLCDKTKKHITILTRNDFYMVNELTDLTPMIDKDKNVTMSPYNISSKYYVWKYPNTFGEFITRYEESHGVQFGSMSVDTGYQFGDASNDVLKSIVYNGATDSLESSINYRIYGGWRDPDYGLYGTYNFKFAYTEGVKWNLYAIVEEELESIECAPIANKIESFDYNQSHPFYDWMVRPQLHDGDNKPESGEDVLLFFSGCVDNPTWGGDGYIIMTVEMYISDDNPYMLALNADKPCWDVSVGDSAAYRKKIGFLPSFRRFKVNDANHTITNLWDFSTAGALAFPDYQYSEQGMGLYKWQWKDYISDRLDVDSKVMTCYVHWGARKVDESLLREMYFYDNSLWVLNKIKNYSVGSLEPCECEFVRVKDKLNYVRQLEY